MAADERRCPFLKEEKVAFCRAFPLRKPLPCDRIYTKENLCLKPEHVRCPVYQEKKGGTGTGEGRKVCPFFELETVMYCELFPIKKMIPSSCYRLECPCTSEGFAECPLYRQVAYGDLQGGEGPFEVREDRFYHPNHLWLRVRGDSVRVGIDDFGQFLLGHVERIHPPRPGEAVEAGRPLLGIRGVTGEVYLPSPLTGVVERINERLLEDPSLLNKDPYGRGWIAEICPEAPGEIEGIIPAEEARGWMQRELRRVQGMLQDQTTGTMADGGELCREVLREMGKEKWELLVREFLEKERGDERC